MKAVLQNNKLYLSYFVVAIFLVFLFYSMWNTASIFSEDKSTQMEIFSLAAKWVSDNLEEGEIAIISFPHIYWSIDPSLKQKTIPFDTFWETANIFSVKSTDNEINQIRDDLKKYIQKNDEIKYLVFDWFNSKSFSIINGLSCNQLDPSLVEVKKFTFKEPNSGYSKSMIVCQVMR